MGTACYVKGSGKILEDIENSFDVKVGENHCPWRNFPVSLVCTACGHCAAVVSDGVAAPKQDSETVLAKLKSFSQ
jgi:bidirectional [NiFe] hydrogenase diaphorase subunit